MKNYIKKDDFTPIAMKCNQEQFEEIKPILEMFGIHNNTYNFIDFEYVPDKIDIISENSYNTLTQPPQNITPPAQ
mgnify:CR=1 FL=1